MLYAKISKVVNMHCKHVLLNCWKVPPGPQRKASIARHTRDRFATSLESTITWKVPSGPQRKVLKLTRSLPIANCCRLLHVMVPSGPGMMTPQGKIVVKMITPSCNTPCSLGTVPTPGRDKFILMSQWASHQPTTAPHTVKSAEFANAHQHVHGAGNLFAVHAVTSCPILPQQQQQEGTDTADYVDQQV